MKKWEAAVMLLYGTNSKRACVSLLRVHLKKCVNMYMNCVFYIRPRK